MNWNSRMDIQCISNERALLGESPIWSESENAIYWVDIIGKKLHRTMLESRTTLTWKLPSCPGMVALRNKGGLVIALEDGLYTFQPGSGELQLLVAVEASMPNNRPNDGKCDCAGRLWLGTMNKVNADHTTGSLYRIDPDLTITAIATRYRIPNGAAWSPNNDLMYHTDTKKDVVWAYDFDSKAGQISNKREYLRFEQDFSGAVDGAAVDTNGGYWSAMYGGGFVRRTFSNGEVDSDILLPIMQPTMPAFGGRDMKTLFITTARQKLSDQELRDQPMAGALLSVNSKFRGTPVYPFGG